MIVTDKLGFIAHPNTGSRSIRAALESIGGREVGGYHEVHQPSVESLDFIFCTIRNPWDLMASWYLRTTGGRGHCFDEWLPMTLGGLRHYEGPGGLFYGVRDSGLVMRFEHLQEDFDRVMEFMREPLIELNHIGRTNRTHGYRYFYCDQEIRLVAEAYPEQIEMGRYEF